MGSSRRWECKKDLDLATCSGLLGTGGDAVISVKGKDSDVGPVEVVDHMCV